MLKIHFGNKEPFIYDTSMYFDNTFEEEWMVSDLAKRMILDIDKSEVLGPYCIQSPVLGQIPPYMLSNGVKTLLLMLNEPETVYNGTTCGNNCAKWMVEVGKEVDVEIVLNYVMSFREAGEFEIQVSNDGKIVHNMSELLPYALEYLDEERDRRLREAGGEL